MILLPPGTMVDFSYCLQYIMVSFFFFFFFKGYSLGTGNLDRYPLDRMECKCKYFSQTAKSNRLSL